MLRRLNKESQRKSLIEWNKRLKVLVVNGTYPHYVLNIVGFAEIMEIIVEVSRPMI